MMSSKLKLDANLLTMAVTLEIPPANAGTAKRYRGSQDIEIPDRKIRE